MSKSTTLKATIWRAVVASTVLGAAVAAQANVLSYTSQVLAGVNTGTQIDHISIPQFNPTWGVLQSVTVTYGNFAYSESSLSNLTTSTRFEIQNSLAKDSITVKSGSITVGGSVTASTSYSGNIAGGFTNDLIDQQISGGTSTFTLPADLAQFTGLGNVFVDNNTITSGQFGQQGNYYGFSFNIGEAQAQVDYNYRTVPSPAAAATMLIGVVGGFVRRRKSA